MNMDSAGQCMASGNLAWLRVAWLLSPAIPVNRAGVELLRSQMNDPGKLDDVLVQVEVAVAPGTRWKDLKDQIKEGLRYVTPEEPLHAMVLACYDAIQRGDSEETLM